MTYRDNLISNVVAPANHTLIWGLLFDLGLFSLFCAIWAITLFAPFDSIWALFDFDFVYSGRCIIWAISFDLGLPIICEMSPDLHFFYYFLTWLVQ